MTVIEKIKAEIERRLKDYWEISFHDTNSYNKDTNVKELKELLSFISTLESEKPMEQVGLEKEMEKFIETFGWGKTKHLAEKELISATARHFYELGCTRTAEKYDEIEYNRQRAEVCEGLEKEIDRFEDWMETYNQADYPTSFTTRDIARHFAEWGYLRAAEKYNEIEYNRQRAEEDTPNDLEEAAKNYALNTAEDSEQYSARYLGYKDGAKWQAKRMKDEEEKE